VPKPVALLEGIRNRENSALIQSTAKLWTSDKHFILLRSIGVYGKPLPVEHLRIHISCLCQRAPLYRPMLMSVCLSGVTGLVV